MANINDNTVSAENQMKNSSETSFLGESSSNKKVLIVGNSITRHGPCHEIGWERDWGMAASSIDKDYVHRLFSKLKSCGENVYFMIRQASYWERHFFEENVLNKYKAEHDFNADIVVFRMGENILVEQVPQLKENIMKFINYICPTGKVIFTTCFWGKPQVDNIIEEVAKERKEVCVKLNDLGNIRLMMAYDKFTHPGIAMHPGDDGMEVIAERLFQQIMQTDINKKV